MRPLPARLVVKSLFVCHLMRQQYANAMNFAPVPLTTEVLVAADIQPTALNTLAALGDFPAAGCYMIAELAAVIVARHLESKGVQGSQHCSGYTHVFRQAAACRVRGSQSHKRPPGVQRGTCNRSVGATRLGQGQL